MCHPVARIDLLGAVDQVHQIRPVGIVDVSVRVVDIRAEAFRAQPLAGAVARFDDKQSQCVP